MSNIEPLVIKGFKRVNEFADAETLDATELTKLENMILDSQGAKAVKRGGFSIYNTNSAGSGIYSLHDVVDPSGNNLLLAAIGTTFKKSTNGTGTWSTIKSGLTSNLKTRLVAFNDKFFVTNDSDAPFMTDGSSVWSLGLSRLDVSSISTTVTSSGRLTPAVRYKWMIIGVTALGEFTPPSRPFTHYVQESNNNSTNSGSLGIIFSGLPISGDSRIVSRYLFRTKANGEAFYLSGRLDNVSTGYTDDKADTELDLSVTIKYNQQAATAKYIETHNERLFLASVSLTDDTPLITHANSTYVPHGVAENIVGGGLAGTYTYKVLFVDEYNRVSAIITTSSVVVSSPNNTVKLWNLPIPPSANVECRLYRNTSGGSTFYYLDSITSGTFIDDYADAEITSRPTILTPTSSSTVFPSGVIFSEIGKPSEISPYNIIQVFPDDADEITGLVDDRDGVIVIKKNSICKIFTTGNPLNWKVEKLFSQIGCDQPNSIQKIGERIYFINNKQIYRYPDYINAPLSIPIKNTMASIISVHDATYFNTNQWYMLIVYINSTKYLICYDEKLECFYKFYSGNQTWECLVEKVYGTERGTLIAGHTAVNILTKYDTSVTTDNDGVGTAEIMALLKTKTFTIPEATSLIRLRKLYSNYKKKDDQNVNHILYDPQKGFQKTGIDSTNATDLTDYKDYEIPTDAMTNTTGVLQTCKKLYYEISGYGLTEFNVMKLFYRITNRGSRAI